MSDVPVGSLLSGGVDSTAVTSVMRGHMTEPPRSFAVGFAGAPDGGELALARRAAAAIGVPLTEVEVTGDEYLATWLRQVARLGEPIANTGTLLVTLLCRAVGATHKVVLTGQGADEPLGGYPRHAAERFYSLGRAVGPLLGPLLGRLPEWCATSDRVARMRRIAGAPDRARRFTEILAVFGPQEASLLTGGGVDADHLSAPVRR
jgi:asparagine synthase (glutamine-hydrolysing)